MSAPKPELRNQINWLFCIGKTRKEIAEAVGIRADAVPYHLKKLGYVAPRLTPYFAPPCDLIFSGECIEPAKANGLCGRHLQRLAKHGDTSVSLTNREHDGTCSVADCEALYYGNGLCKRHSDRARAHGSPTLADDLIDAQGGVCAICGLPPRGRGHEARLHLDHDHQTGRVRGMLCGPCNKAIGLLEDDADRLERAASYLRAIPEEPI